MEGFKTRLTMLEVQEHFLDEKQPTLKRFLGLGILPLHHHFKLLMSFHKNKRKLSSNPVASPCSEARAATP